MWISAPQAPVLPDGPGLQFPALFCAVTQILTSPPVSHTLAVLLLEPNRQFPIKPHYVVCLLAFLLLGLLKLLIFLAQSPHSSSCIPSVLFSPAPGGACTVIASALSVS